MRRGVFFGVSRFASTPKCEFRLSCSEHHFFYGRRSTLNARGQVRFFRSFSLSSILRRSFVVVTTVCASGRVPALYISDWGPVVPTETWSLCDDSDIRVSRTAPCSVVRDHVQGSPDGPPGVEVALPVPPYRGVFNAFVVKMESQVRPNRPWSSVALRVSVRTQL